MPSKYPSFVRLWLCSAIAQGRRTGIAFISALLVVGCAVDFAPLVSAKKTGAEVLAAAPDAPERSGIPTAGRVQPEAVFSHRKLLQTGVAKTGAPVYRFVECRHLPKEERKLVQVGISRDGLAMLRVKPGDYCIFGESPVTEPTAIAVSASKSVDAASGQPRSALDPIQQYVCEKFGPDCRVALAIQRAENATGQCDLYHYNTSDGTLDWGYFQINSVHLRRPGLNLRDLLDCKANIDYAYQLFLESGFAPWTTYTSGAYRKFLPLHRPEQPLAAVAQALTVFHPPQRPQ